MNKEQRLKEDLSYAQQRNKHQRQQLANYKKVHEKDFKEIERLHNIIKEVRETLQNTMYPDVAIRKSLEILDKGE